MTAPTERENVRFHNTFDDHVGKGQAVLAQAAPKSNGQVLGPDSLTWKYFGDWRLQLFGFQRVAGTETGIAQIGKGLYEHSAVWDDIAGRAKRTAAGLMNVVYNADQQAWGRKVRDFHTTVKGTMDDGSRYHALTPELFYWIHATTVDHIIFNTDMFIRRLSYEEKAQIFEEGKAWYALYGVSDRPQPQTYDEFLQYWENMLDRAVPTQTVMHGTGYLRRGIPGPKSIPKPVWRVLSAPLNAYARTMVVGTLPAQVRSVCRLQWSNRQERRFQRCAAVIRALNPIVSRLPVRMTYVSPAVRAWTREGIDPRKLHNTPPAA
jgi:uncharacterized protein (DUF2236 family)